MVEDTADTVPPIACVVTGLTLLISLEVDTQMPALHPAAMLAAMVAPVRVRVIAVPAATLPDPTAIVKLVAGFATVAVVPKKLVVLATPPTTVM